MTGMPRDAASQSKLRIATITWFAVLLGCLLATDAIAQLDTRLIAVVVVTATTVMFTCMQVIARETAAARSTVRAEVRPLVHRSVSDLAVRSLIAVASIYAILWALGALPF